jgi:hypothetical protein
MKCANPDCHEEGLYLRSGSVHELDFVAADKEAPGDRAITRKIVWLCGKCTIEFKVETWRPPGQQLQPKSRGTGSTPGIPTPAGKIRLGVRQLA